MRWPVTHMLVYSKTRFKICFRVVPLFGAGCNSVLRVIVIFRKFGTLPSTPYGSKTGPVVTKWFRFRIKIHLADINVQVLYYLT